MGLETVPRETPPSEVTHTNSCTMFYIPFLEPFTFYQNLFVTYTQVAYTGVPHFLAEFDDGGNVFTRPFSHQLTQTNNQITEYRL